MDSINGLPLHPLVVHGVVVLLPLAVLGTIAIVVRPRWRATYGWLVVAITAVATALIPIATNSGEALEKLVGDPGKHADLGKQLIWFALALLILDIVWVWLGRRPETSQAIVVTVAVLAVLAALATAVQVYRVGESGARSAWGGVIR